MHFFRQNLCSIVGINIYKLNIYICQKIGRWTTFLIPQEDEEEEEKDKHEERLVSPSHVSTPHAGSGGTSSA